MRGERAWERAWAGSERGTINNKTGHDRHESRLTKRWTEVLTTTLRTHSPYPPLPQDVFYTQEMRRMRKQLVDSWILVSIILMLGAYSKIKWFDERRFEGVAIGRFKSVAIGRFGDVNDHSLHPFHVTEHSFRRFGHANLFVFLMVHFDEMRCFGRGVGRV